MHTHEKQPKRGERSALTKQRILSAAFVMIAENGIGGVTMSGVATAADVTEMTVYNLFGSKTGLIDKLVEKYQRELVDRSQAEDATSLDGIRNAVRAIALDLGREPRWAAAIAHLYFSEKTGQQTHDRLRSIGVRHLRLAADLITTRNPEKSRRTIDMAMYLFANTGYALVHDLALGRIDGATLADLLIFALDSFVEKIQHTAIDW